MITPEPVQLNAAGTATLLRSIIHFTYTPITVGIFDVAIGMAVVTLDAITGLVLPDPLTDFQQSWYYWTERFMQSAAGTINQVDWDVDLRTARRLRGGYGMVIISETPLLGASSTLNITMRNLWRIP